MQLLILFLLFAVTSSSSSPFCLIGLVKPDSPSDAGNYWVVATIESKVISVKDMSAGKLPEDGFLTFIVTQRAAKTTRLFLSSKELKTAYSICATDPDERERSIPSLHSGFTWLSPVTVESQKIMLGLNYKAHAAEANMQTPEFKMIFPKMSKPTSAFSKVLRPPHVLFLDYECEMGVVLSKDLTEKKEITTENIGEYVAGVVLVHDYSARGIQVNENQWVKGKGFQTFAPIGPFLALFPEKAKKGEINRLLHSIRIKLWRGSTVKQNAITSDLVFDVPSILTELNHDFSMRAGDVIYTGTPEGVIVGEGKKPPAMILRLLEMIFGSLKYRYAFLPGKPFAEKKWLQIGEIITAAAYLDVSEGNSGVPSGALIGISRNEIHQASDWKWKPDSIQDIASKSSQLYEKGMEALQIFSIVLFLGFIIGIIFYHAFCSVLQYLVSVVFNIISGLFMFTRAYGPIGTFQYIGSLIFASVARTLLFLFRLRLKVTGEVNHGGEEAKRIGSSSVGKPVILHVIPELELIERRIVVEKSSWRGRPDPGYTDGYAHRITEAGNPNATFEKTIVCIGGVPSDSSHTFFWVAKYLLRLDKTVRCIIIHLPYCEEETIPTPTYPDTVRARYLPQVAPFNVDD
eukprot:g3383.t1